MSYKLGDVIYINYNSILPDLGKVYLFNNFSIDLGHPRHLRRMYYYSQIYNDYATL